jgi:hypothetical protein
MTASLLIPDLPGSIDILSEWRWKIGGAARIVELSLSGDAFVSEQDGRVLWLDTGGGTLTEVAPSQVAFYERLTRPREAAELLLAPVVEEFIRRRGPIPPGKCLGFNQYPVLGGSYKAENRWPAPILEHFGVTGEVHRQIRDLPDGTPIRIQVSK